MRTRYLYNLSLTRRLRHLSAAHITLYVVVRLAQVKCFVASWVIFSTTYVWCCVSFGDGKKCYWWIIFQLSAALDVCWNDTWPNWTLWKWPAVNVLHFALHRLVQLVVSWILLNVMLCRFTCGLFRLQLLQLKQISVLVCRFMQIN